MANRPALIKKRTKKTRSTKGETYLINKKHMGDEPSFKGVMTNIDYINALNWYNTMCDTSDARDYLKEYLKAQGRTAELKKLSSVPDTWIPTTAAWIARMIHRGCNVMPTSRPFLEMKLKECYLKAKVEQSEQKGQTISIQDRIREKTLDLIGDIEQMIDSGESFELFTWMKTKEIPAQYSTAIIAHYSGWLQELIEAYEGKDEQLNEAYRHMTKKQIKDRILFINSIVEDAGRYGNVTKQTRAPRKPRPVSVEKKLKHFKYQKEFPELKIASVNPEKIIGCQELWTYNTKYKIVTVFRALDRGGLQINRSSITGFDESSSYSKGCGRKPEIIIDKIQKGGKIVLRKLIDDLKTDKPLQVRINENTIIMKVVT